MFNNSAPLFGTQQQSVFGQNNNVFAPKPFGTPTTTFGTQAAGSMFSGTSTGNFGGGTQAFSSPAFGTQQPSVFGQNNNVFAPKPFGNPITPFGTQAAGSMFSGTSTGNFGGGTQAFSSPAFGTQAAGSFGTSTPAFGTSSFAGTSTFGQKPATTFGVNAITPGFGTPTTTPAFGTPTTPVFGTQPTTPAFGIGLGGGFGQPNSGFGATNAASTTSPFGVQTFNSGTSPGFGNNPSTPSPFGTQSSSFSFQTTIPSTFGTPAAFGQPGFGQQKRGGSRVVAYSPPLLDDIKPDGAPGAAISKAYFQSISCMPVYAEKSQEELRWEDYQLGDKGGPKAFGTPQTNLFTSTTATPNPFGLQKTTGFPTFTSPFNTSGTAGSTNVFNQPSAPAFPQNLGTTPSTSPATPNTFTFQQPNNAPFSSTPVAPNPFNITPTFPQTNLFQQPSTTPSFTTPGFTFGTTPSTATSPFNSTPATPNTFGLTIGVPPAFQQTINAPAPFNSTPAPPNPLPFQQPNNTPSLLSNTVGAQNSGIVNNSTPSPPSWSPFSGQTNPSQQTQPASTFSSNVSTSIGVAPSVFTPNSFVQNTFPQLSTDNQSTPAATQPSGVATNPFGTVPAVPQISIGHTRAAPSVQYGISKMPVVEKAAPVRVSSLLMTSRFLSQCRIRSSARRSCPKNNAFSDDEKTLSTPKADALFIPRENPRAPVINPLEHCTSRTSAEKSKDTHSTPLHENGKLSEKDSGSSLNGTNPSLAENGHDKDRTVNENGADIEALLPKFRFPDYYTEPRIQELAAKERAEPGFCSRVKDFIVGRIAFGSIKFAGETDVRNLDLESLVQFNNREVIVYLDDSKKPPVGQGLNKAAVVTLLNIKCFDKKTGQQCMEGRKVEKYKERLIKKARDQGAEFVSYDPIKGEWKFRVDHF